MINFDIGNHYGNLYAYEKDGKYFWGVNCVVNGTEEEIPEDLFVALKAFSDRVSPKPETKLSSFTPTLGALLSPEIAESAIASLKRTEIMPKTDKDSFRQGDQVTIRQYRNRLI